MSDKIEALAKQLASNICVQLGGWSTEDEINGIAGDIARLVIEQVAAAQADEREAVVQWLRSQATNVHDVSVWANSFASRIEAGCHKRGKP